MLLAVVLLLLFGFLALVVAAAALPACGTHRQRVAALRLVLTLLSYLENSVIADYQ
jgi:hypothetical protein